MENQLGKSPKNEKIFWKTFNFRYFPLKYWSSCNGGLAGGRIRTLLTFFVLILSLGFFFFFYFELPGGGDGVGRREDIMILSYLRAVKSQCGPAGPIFSNQGLRSRVAFSGKVSSTSDLMVSVHHLSHSTLVCAHST